MKIIPLPNYNLIQIFNTPFGMQGDKGKEMIVVSHTAERRKEMFLSLSPSCLDMKRSKWCEIGHR